MASRSPQRRAILEQLGIKFEVRPADVDELTEGPAEAIAVENARRKAEAVASGVGLVLGVDTVVSLGDRLYGKPSSADEARATLKALSGRRHQVISGLCLIDDRSVSVASASTEVEFRELSEAVIEWYLDTGEWRERAGGYAIQGRGAALVERVEGDYSNIVGLPVAKLLDLAPGLAFR